MPKFFVTMTVTVHNAKSAGNAIDQAFAAVRHGCDAGGYDLSLDPATDVDAVYIETPARTVVPRREYDEAAPPPATRLCPCGRPVFKLGDRCAVCVPPA